MYQQIKINPRSVYSFGYTCTVNVFYLACTIIIWIRIFNTLVWIVFGAFLNWDMYTYSCIAIWRWTLFGRSCFPPKSETEYTTKCNTLTVNRWLVMFYVFTVSQIFEIYWRQREKKQRMKCHSKTWYIRIQIGLFKCLLQESLFWKEQSIKFVWRVYRHFWL